MAVEDVELERGFPQMREPTACSFCHNVIDGRALYCDVCGHATLRSLELKRASLQSEIRELENAAQRVRLSKTDIDALNDRLKGLSDALQPLSVEVEELRTKKRELTTESENLSSQIAQLGTVRQSEEAAIDYLRKERRQAEQVKNPASKNGKRGHVGPQRTKRRHGVKQRDHTFICKYEGPSDWNAELAKLIAQFELSLDESGYSVLPKKIVFTVRGTRENIEKLAAALNGLEGFVNLRSELAGTKKSLQESVEARNTHRQQLESLNSIAWYKRNNRNVTEQKTALEKRIAEDDAQIKRMAEDLKALRDLLASE